MKDYKCTLCNFKVSEKEYSKYKNQEVGFFESVLLEHFSNSHGGVAMSVSAWIPVREIDLSEEFRGD